MALCYERSRQLFDELGFLDDPKQAIGVAALNKMISHVFDCLGAVYHCLHDSENVSKVGLTFDPLEIKVFGTALKAVSEICLCSIVPDHNKFETHPQVVALLEQSFPDDRKTGIKHIDGRRWLSYHWACALADKLSLNHIRDLASEDSSVFVGKPDKPLVGIPPGHLIASCPTPNLSAAKFLFNSFPLMARLTDDNGDVPLHAAARHSDSYEMISLLLEVHPAATKAIEYLNGNNPLQSMMYRGANVNPANVELLLKYDKYCADYVNSDGDNVLRIAAVHECPEEVLNMLMSDSPMTFSKRSDSSCKVS